MALLALGNVLHWFGPHPWAPTASWWLVAAGAALLFSPPGRLALAAGGARLLLRGVKAGRHPRGGSVHLRLWTAERLAEYTGATSLTGSWLERYGRALGAKIGPEVDLHSLPPVTGMLKLGRGCAVESEVDLSGHWLDGDRLEIGQVKVGAGAVVGTRSILFPGARVGKRAEVAPGSAVVGQIPTGQRWAGAPAGKLGKAKRNWPSERPPRGLHWRAMYGATGFGLTVLPVVATVPALLVVSRFVPADAGLTEALRGALFAVVPGALAFGCAYALLLLVAVRLLSLGLRTGNHPTHSRVGWQAWTVTQLMDLARDTLFPLYAGLITPVWLRLLGMKIGRGAEVSTVLALPSLTTVGEGAFLADDTLTAPFELGGGWVRIGPSEIGRRAFLGNSGMTAPGRTVPDDGLVGVLSATPKKAKKGSSYLGLPPVRLPRSTADADQSRTYHPPARLLWARGLVELCRLLPVFCSAALAVLTVAALCALTTTSGLGLGGAALLSGAVLLAAGAAACAVAVAAKWLLVGRHRAGEHPLWSGFVWRNELADTFVEVLAVPWLAGSVPGTPLLALWLRALGARVGRGVWCESYWLPETDLVELGDGVSVNRGCVLQTHLFHDRILRTDTVVLREGATLGPGGIVLPGSTVGARSTLGPASLVMAGESVPADTRWLGNPIEAYEHSAGSGSERPADSGIGPVLSGQRRLPLPRAPVRTRSRLPSRPQPARRDRPAQCDRRTGTAHRVPPQPGRVQNRPRPGERPGAALHPPGRQAPHPPGQAAARRRRLHRRGALGGQPQAGAQPLGRPRLGGTDRRRAGGQPARRRALLVPVQRPARRQGLVPDLGQHALPLHGRRERPAAHPHDEGQHDHLALRAVRADLQLPGRTVDRHVPDGAARRPRARWRPAERPRTGAPAAAVLP